MYEKKLAFFNSTGYIIRTCGTCTYNKKGGEEDKKWERVGSEWGSERFAAFEKRNLFKGVNNE